MPVATGTMGPENRPFSEESPVETSRTIITTLEDVKRSPEKPPSLRQAVDLDV
jgi:hypothetical protein